MCATTAVDPRFWEQVLAADCAVPAQRPLHDLTVELVELLGTTDPHLRDELAATVLATWIDRGVYDDLLPGLGDGLAEGLRVGLRERGTQSVLRRSFSAAVLARVLARDAVRPRVPRETALVWGDRGLAWLVAERDLRGHVPGAGRAQALRHGAELVQSLAASRHLDEGGLVVLLDTVADRLLCPDAEAFASREEDAFALAAMRVLHRNAVDLAVLEAWIDRLSAGWLGAGRHGEPIPPQTLNTVNFLRSLHLMLLLGVGDGPDPAVRVDLLGLLQSVLRTSGPFRSAP
ncbi:MAG: DUF2785 domain-containing protein [Sporichthyaceae bacterium]